MSGSSLLELKRGATNLIEGLNLVSTQRELLSKFLYTSIVSTIVCIVATSICYVIAFPLKLFNVHVTFDACLYFVSVIALQIMRVVLPNFSSDVFFMSLALKSPSDSKSIRGIPIKRSIYRIIFTMILEIVFGLGALGIFIFFWGTISPILIGVVLALGPALWMGVLPVIILVISVYMCCTSMQIYKILSKARKVSTLLAITIVLLVVTGILHGFVLEFIMNFIYASILSLYISEQLLTQYSIRLEEKIWQQWRDSHKYSLIGFGLPIYVLITYGHPFVALVLLQLLQGAAAVYLGFELQLNNSVIKQQ